VFVIVDRSFPVRWAICSCPLNVLYQGEFQQTIIGQLLDHTRNRVQAGQASGAPPSFPRDQLIAITAAAGDEGLDDTVGANGLCKFGEPVRLKDGPRLERIGVDLIDRQLGQSLS